MAEASPVDDGGDLFARLEASLAGADDGVDRRAEPVDATGPTGGDRRVDLASFVVPRD